MGPSKLSIDGPTYFYVDVLRGPIYVRAMGRRQINHEEINARFPAGTLARVDALLEPKEKRADFIREAVSSEIKKRERRTSAATKAEPPQNLTPP